MKLNIIISFLIISNINLFATFIKEGNTVKDSKTNLMWQDNSDVKSNSQDWGKALEYCEALTLGDYNNWRLPNIRELLSIANKNRHAPVIDDMFENRASSDYWSSSSYASNSSYAWYVYFYNGDDSQSVKSDSYYVRCVRDQ